MPVELSVELGHVDGESLGVIDATWRDGRGEVDRDDELVLEQSLRRSLRPYSGSASHPWSRAPRSSPSESSASLVRGRPEHGAVPPRHLPRPRLLLPPRTSLRGAPWEEYVDWAIAQGLAPLAAYNLEYRLGGGGAPEWARDRLLRIYQGSLNDNVMKLVNFKRAVDELEGRAHRAARAAHPSPRRSTRTSASGPVLEIAAAAAARWTWTGFAGLPRAAEFKPESTIPTAARCACSPMGARRSTLTRRLLGPGCEAEDRASSSARCRSRLRPVLLPARSWRTRCCSPCLEQARAGYHVPLLTFVDLRELLHGAPSMQRRLLARRWTSPAPASARSALAARARALRLDPHRRRALPRDARRSSTPCAPDLRRGHPRAARAAGGRPLAQLGRMRETRGAERAPADC